MRSALQRLLARPLAVRLLRSCRDSSGQFSYELVCRNGKDSRKASNLTHIVEEVQENDAQGRWKGASALAAEDTARTAPLRKYLSSARYRDVSIPAKDKYKGTTRPSQGGSARCREQEQEQDQRQDQGAAIWFKILDTVREQRRHFGMFRTWQVYLKVMQSQLDMPTEGELATELWEHLIQVGSSNSHFLWTVAEYAGRLRQRTGRVRHGLYANLMRQQLCCFPSHALSLHRFLKAEFPPEPEDYKRLLKLSLLMDQGSLAIFEKIYKDHPVPDMYTVVVPELCKRGMRTEATSWHYLLLQRNDLPRSFHDCKPLFEHYAQVKKHTKVEKLALSLGQRQVWFEKDVENFVQNDKLISREIMNRALGEAHKIAPKTISDSFCARLFATRFLSIDTVITGLQAVGLGSMGPSSLREIVIRDDYECEKVTQHMHTLQESGIQLQACKYSAMIEKAAAGGQSRLLKLIADTDLHPDAFEDMNLQERLLAMYCDKGDNTQMERTLAILEYTVPERSLKMQRANLLLRCYITARNKPKVISILESMQRNQYPLAPRSSRHFRSAYLSPRRKGVPPSESGHELKTLTLIINVMKMTLQAGATIPLESWVEILKRLGMMGHLPQYQNLAMWLVDWYGRLPSSEPLHKLNLPDMRADGLLLSTTRTPIKSLYSGMAANGSSPLASLTNALTQNRDLLLLFGKEAQQGIIAWGFLAEVRRRPNLPHPRKTRLPRKHWQWGLRLLKDLQIRGIPIDKKAVARACKLRLAQLFNHAVISNKKSNRRAKQVNDIRSTLMARFRYSAYIRGMEDIWGRDLFEPGLGGLGTGEKVLHGPINRKWRLIRSTFKSPK